MLHRADTFVCLILLALCGTLFYLTTTFEAVPVLLSQNIAPGSFPVLVLAIIAVLSLGLPFERYVRRRSGADLDSARRARIEPMTYLTAALLILVVFATPYVGAISAIFGASLALPLLWGERRLKLVLPFAVLFPALVVLLFSWVLQVRLEPGMLGLFGN